MKKKIPIPFFVAIVVVIGVAIFFRCTGINWDQNYHLNPDERFLTMVAMDISLPTSIHEYFNTETSPLNPHNTGYGFYVYGTWPVYLVKAIAIFTNHDNYDEITIIGRSGSIIADLITLCLVYLIGYTLSKRKWAGVCSAFVYSTMALPIQASHFFTVDPYVTTFLAATLYILTKPPTTKRCVALAFCFGIAVAAKISAAIVAPTIAVWFFLYEIKNKKYMRLCIYGLLFLLIFYSTMRIFLPYLFSNAQFFSFALNEKLLDNWKQLKSFDNPSGWYPPGVQWITTKAYLFPLGNMIFVGLGLPLALFCLPSLSIALKKYNQEILMLCVFIFCLFGYQGMQFAKAARYFYSLYPALAVLVGYGIWILWHAHKKLHPFIGCALAALLIWPTMMTSIYRTPHTRITASDWIYKNIQPGSVIGIEHWDDGLPLPIKNERNDQYTFVELPLYDQDTEKKWITMNEKIDTVDYIILSSNRLYGSITSVPTKYPETNVYYKKLFDGSLGFKKVAEFISRPSLPLPVPVCIHLPWFSYGTIAEASCDTPGIQIIDDYVDESWTVYDHPKVIIFEKIK